MGGKVQGVATGVGAEGQKGKVLGGEELQVLRGGGGVSMGTLEPCILGCREISLRKGE